MTHGNRKQYTINNRDYLFDLYWNKKMSQKKISSMVGCSIFTVQRRMKEFSIKGRPWSSKGLKFPNQNTTERLLKMAEGRKKSIIWRRSLLGRKRADMMGEKHFNWKGGKTTKDKLDRVKFQHSIQKQVFERDNYTCLLCGEHGGKLQVDHIQSWSEYVELRFNIENCRTLCMACHYKVTFGKPMPPTVRAWGHNLKEVNLL